MILTINNMLILTNVLIFSPEKMWRTFADIIGYQLQPEVSTRSLCSTDKSAERMMTADRCAGQVPVTQTEAGMAAG